MSISNHDIEKADEIEVLRDYAKSLKEDLRFLQSLRGHEAEHYALCRRALEEIAKGPGHDDGDDQWRIARDALLGSWTPPKVSP